jgi:hypothetical protein
MARAEVAHVAGGRAAFGLSLRPDHDRAIGLIERVASVAAARVWPIGAGHVGLAYQREGELVNDDVATEEVFQGKGELNREYDKAR